MRGGRSILRACARLAVLALHIQYGLLLIVLYRYRYGGAWYDSDQGHTVIRWWAKRACRILSLHVRMKGAASIVRGTLFVSNHVSWMDIIALSSLIEAKFLSKETVKYWPVIGALASASGTLFIRRGKYFAVNGVIETIREKLDNNYSILIFPEGTTTDGRRVGRFHAAMFKSVSDSGHFVQAVALRYRRHGKPDELAPYIGNDNFLGHLFKVASLGETRLEVAFTMPFQALNLSRNAIADMTHAAIADILREQEEPAPSGQWPVAWPKRGKSVPA